MTSSFLTKAAKVASGHAAGYGVALAVSPLLARLYGAEAFGFFAVFVLLVSSLTIVATMRLDQAIPLAKSRRGAMVISQLAVGSTMLAAVGVLIIGAVTMKYLPQFMTRQLPDLWVPVLANAMMCLAIYQMVAAWLLRDARYRELAGMRIVFALTMALTQLAIPICGGSLMLGLPAGQAAGFAAGAAFGGWRCRRQSPTLQRIVARSAKRIAGRYRNFAQFGVPAALISNIGIHAPALLLALCYGLEVAGVFALAQRVFTTPLTLLTNSFSRVFLAEAARQPTADSLARLFRSTVKSGLLIAAVPIGIVAVIAPLCFGTVFGDSWRAAGWICTLLAPMAIAMSLSQIVNPVFDLVGRQDQRLSRELFCTLLITGGLLAIWLGGGSAYWAIGTASLGGCIGYLLIVAMAAKYVGGYHTATTETEPMTAPTNDQPTKVAA